VFFFGGIILYNIVKKTIDKNINKELLSSFHQAMSYTKKNPGNLSSDSLPLLNAIEISKVNRDNPGIGKIMMKDTILYDKIETAYKPYRYISGYMLVDGEMYRIRVYKSLIETNALIEKIALTIAGMTLFFVFGVFFIIKIISQHIWKDFLNTVELVGNYDVTNRLQKIDLPDSEISEFTKLNKALEKMIERIRKDYYNLKEFTENLTHELQTPLSVIKTRVELLLQQENLGRENAENLSDINKNLAKITRLNRGLVLLTKIENQQFEEKKLLDLKKIIDNQLENFEDFILSRELKVQKNLDAAKQFYFNPILADILFMNLVKNAIFHNHDKGTVNIFFRNETFGIENTSNTRVKNPGKMFARFKRAGNKTASLGIGLSLVKTICDHYQLEIHYLQENNMHGIYIKGL
jgi:signal transduction histidine kinase